MRIIRAVPVFLLLFVTIFTLQPSVSYASTCPSQWNVPLAPLQFTPYSGISDGFPYQLWDSNYTSGWKESNPALADLVTPLGNNVVVKPSWEISNSQNFASGIYSPSHFHEVFQESNVYPIWDWDLKYAGIGNGTWLRFSLTIDVNGCPSSIFHTSPYQFTQLQNQPMTMDQYFEKLQNYFDPNDPNKNANLSFLNFNFEQVNWIKETVNQDIQIISNPQRSSNNLQTKEVDSGELKLFFNWLPVGEAPANCLDSFTTRSYPQVNPQYVVVNKSPCSVSVYFPIKINQIYFATPAEQSKNCISPTCMVPSGMSDLMNKYPYLQGGGSYAGYSYVEVANFNIPALSLKPDPTSSAASNTKIVIGPNKKNVKHLIWYCVNRKASFKFSGTKVLCPAGFTVKK